MRHLGNIQMLSSCLVNISGFKDKLFDGNGLFAPFLFQIHYLTMIFLYPGTIPTIPMIQKHIETGMLYHSFPTPIFL